jgi:mycothiol synthase
LSARRPTLADCEALLELFNSFDIPKYGQPNQSLASIKNMLTRPGFDLETDAWLVVTAGGQFAGYNHAMKDEENHFLIHGGVHPAYCRQGIGTHLLRLAEARVLELVAQVPPSAHVTLSTICLVNPANEAELRLFKHEGYQVVRHFWDMSIELNTSPPAPVWPQGIAVRTFVPGQDEHQLFETFNEVFQDAWGHSQEPFEFWTHEFFALETFDPTLCFLACEGETIVGFAMCADINVKMGNIEELGVRRTWRKRGLGRALLLHTFHEFAKRGKQVAHLSVDSESLTGATRLYERAGMHVTLHNDFYEKKMLREH